MTTEPMEKKVSKLKDKQLVDYLCAGGIKLEAAQAKVALGLTGEDVMWNLRLDRPLHWLETVDPAEETERRRCWTEAHP